MSDQPNDLPKPSRAILTSELTIVPEQITGENALWYGRFCAWLLMPLPRSVLKILNGEREREFQVQQDKLRKRLARAKGQEKAGINRTLQVAFTPLQKWHGSWIEAVAKFHWAERAAIWDKQETERKNEAFALARDIQRLRELLASEDLYDKARELAQLELDAGMFVDKDGVEHSTQIDPRFYVAAAQMFKEGKAQARAALEMVDKRKRLDVRNMTNAALIEFLREFIVRRSGGITTGDRGSTGVGGSGSVAGQPRLDAGAGEAGSPPDADADDAE